MLPRSRIRLALLAIVAVAPLAAAQPLAPTLSPPATLGTTPPPLPVDAVSIVEARFELEGDPTSPRRLLVRDAEGGEALRYEVDDAGRARLDVGGTNVVEDATLLRLEGDPLGPAFSLVLRDAEGGLHEVRVDRAALGVPIPDAAAPAIEVLRPLAWPDAPARSYLVHVEDAMRNRLSAAQLDGSSFLQRFGEQEALVQVPLKDLRWDRAILQASRPGTNDSANFSFARARQTDNAAIFTAAYDLNVLGPVEGATIELRVIYERRLAPFAVERLPEPVTYRVRLDGVGPRMTLDAPAEVDDFRFDVSWSGEDALSGVRNYDLYYRVAGAATWIPWTPTSARSATFSGEWGRTYEFRATALDHVGNPSDAATATTRVAPQPQGVDDVNDAPTARLLTPRAGSVLAGVASVAWEATDPDGPAVTSRLEVSDDDGLTWRTLFAGVGSTASWDTLAEADGAIYRLRLTVSDGTLSAQDIAPALTVRNVVDAPPAAATVPAPGGSGAPVREEAVRPATTDEGEPAAAEEAPRGKGTPGPAGALLAAAIVGAALVAGRRDRR